MAREVGKKVDILLPPGTDQSWAYKAYMEASMAPHDLTERAAALLNRIVGIIPMQPFQREARIEWLVEYAQETRRAALLEAAHKVRDRALLWRSHGGAKVGFPYGHLTIEGEYESMADELARLASEGG